MRELTSFELALVSGGFGGCDEATGDEIIICAPPPGIPLPSYPPSSPLPPSWTPPSDSPPSSGGNPPPAEPPCDDAHADKAADNLRNLTNLKPNHESKEHLSAVYKDRNGDVKTFGPVEGMQVGLTGAIWEFKDFYTNFTNQTGMDRSSIMAEVHNHPYLVFGHEAALNRYPTSADWISADRAVAAGANPATYSLYIIDTSGELREFPYSLRDYYNNMSAESKRLGLLLPNAMTTIPTPTCG